MIITIHQPEYLPWLGFFDRILKSDILVILDDVQYQKNGFINRNKIKTAQGWQWLTIPVQNRESLGLINKVKINNQENWQENQWKTIFFNYQKAPNFTEYSHFLKVALEKKWENISELDIYLIGETMDILGVKKEIIKSSLMSIPGQGTERLVNICKTLGGDTYLSGPGGESYLEIKKFKEENIKIIFQKFVHPVFSQLFEKRGFIPNLSIIDLIFNCGEKSLNIIKKNN